MRENIQQIIESRQIAAVIFDLDGTLVDNNAFHLKSWMKYISDLGIVITEEEYNANINGRTNHDAAEYIYKRSLTKEEGATFALEKEAVYREMYAPHIAPVPGLMELLEKLKQLEIPMAIATSGIQPNIDFLFEHIPIKKYFSVIVNSAHIIKGKPDPEIYLKASALLDVRPYNCLVFEDAVVGIKSAKAAGMEVIALSTTHPKEELFLADRIIADYREL
ncbi:HAD family phosphatase [Pollutibacter soli]|uniref:HAD family hydrolase n=1 Tax=Pollutibacter soli TaxID=3034157 RepID=UPI0030132EC5